MLKLRASLHKSATLTPLEYSSASHLLAGNVNLALVKHCLGHKTIGSTMKYVAVSDIEASGAARAALMELY